MSNKNTANDIKGELSRLCSVLTKIDNPKLTSAYCISSLVRGDFIPGKSDIDLLLIFKDDTPMEEMAMIAQRIASTYMKLYREEESARDVDILYVREKDIPTSEQEAVETPFSIFGIFAFDVKENNKLLLGSDFLNNLYIVDPKEIARKQINQWITKAKMSPENSLLYSGKIIRALSIRLGLRSVKKHEVIDFIETSTLPEWIKDYTKEHYSSCYNHDSMEIDSVTFIKKIEAYLKKVGL